MKTKVLFVTSCLLVLAACSKDAGSKKGTPWDESNAIPVDQKSIESELGKKLLSVPAWCEESKSDEKTYRSRFAYKNDSTLLQTEQQIAQDGSVTTSEPLKIGWTIDNDRVVYRANVEGKDREMSFVPVFKNENGKECYQMDIMIEDGKTAPARGSDAKVDLYCQCD